jgi:S-adenosylmethionine-diacylglycerol 3-amino-3-carboxypropyl transferase
MINMKILLQRTHQRLFDHLYSRNLIYNACWEDPAVDRQALALGPQDRVLVITSAGCNALDYALAGAGHIDAVDANPRQTALLELKLAGIRTLEFGDFFDMFGRGRHAQFSTLYRKELRPQLSDFAASYWDRRADWFESSPGLYGHGLSGRVAQAFRVWLRFQPALQQAIGALFEAGDLESQRRVYESRVEPLLLGGVMRWALSSQITMSLLGVPVAQHEQVRRQHADGVPGFVREALSWVFCEMPVASNYFWHLHLHGRYEPGCCPEYLKERNFAALKAGAAERIHPITATVTDFLERGEGPISRFVLLDHMDWMASVDEAELGREWAAIRRRASPDARVIFRSAHARPSFLNTVVVPGARGGVRLSELLRLDRRLAMRLQQQDRVHTYAGFHIASFN